MYNIEYTWCSLTVFNIVFLTLYKRKNVREKQLTSCKNFTLAHTGAKFFPKAADRTVNILYCTNKLRKH